VIRDAAAAHIDRPMGARLRDALTGKRLINGTLVAAIGLGSVFSAPAFAVLIALIGIFGVFELKNIARRTGAELSASVAVAACIAYVVLAYLHLLERYESILVGSIIVASLVSAFAHGIDRFGGRCGMTLFASLYLGKLLSYFILLRGAPHGVALTLYVAILVALTDIFGMVAGLRFGRTQMAPRLSPHKTWEGAIGAFIVATGAAVGMAFEPHVALPWWLGLALGATIAVAAEIGDLFESALKRNAQIKDSGQIIGGHGGVLDRFDSYLVAGVAAYTLLGLAGRL
jgi:phosphatidate cytidylyltransferase